MAIVVIFALALGLVHPQGVHPRLERAVHGAPPATPARLDRSAFLRAALGVVAGAAGAAVAAPARAETVASIGTSGLLFKDTLNIESFDDPKVSGVKLYVADFQRPINERLSANFFSDPTQASVTCVRTGTVALAADINTSAEGEEVFSQARSLFFKSVKVRRIYDKNSNALIYVSYSSRLSREDDSNKSRFKSTMCAVPIG
ncbi:hypothetical protein KFE25_012856 [Diacronema lutheri]|uniref:CreA protein n=1 Tax=Diacronema lutheri TaxID=2081491 RepID=A0A8J5X2X5_DIALT|nr:hypothetical protein KFE25_012856 [Diacronema lutheri]